MEDFIDFDCLSDNEEDLQVKAAEAPGVVAIETTISMFPTSVIEVKEPWRVIRDYVEEQITLRFGKFPQSSARDAGIFKGFVKRWGDQALPIAKVAFEVHQGMWHNAPIRFSRFTAASDPYFACVIAEGLGEAASS